MGCNGRCAGEGQKDFFIKISTLHSQRRIKSRLPKGQLPVQRAGRGLHTLAVDCTPGCKDGRPDCLTTRPCKDSRWAPQPRWLIKTSLGAGVGRTTLGWQACLSSARRGRQISQVIPLNALIKAEAGLAPDRRAAMRSRVCWASGLPSPQPPNIDR